MGKHDEGALGGHGRGKEILVEISSAVWSNFKVFAHEKDVGWISYLEIIHRDCDGHRWEISYLREISNGCFLCSRNIAKSSVC